MKDNRYGYDFAGMTDFAGMLLGHLSEEIDIYVPPNDLVLLNKGNDERDSYIVFPVPAAWAKRNIKGKPLELEQLGWRKKVKTKKLLDDFASLAEAKPERYLAFAKKWGPFWHQVMPLDIYYQEYKPNGKVTSWVEHIWFWRILAEEAKVILEIASFLRQNKLAKVALWKSLAPNLAEEKYQTLEQQRELLAGYINIKGEEIIFKNLPTHYPNQYFIRLRVDWSNKKPKLLIVTKMGFFSAMWLQLMQAVTASHVYVCSGCSRVYVRDRRPAEGRNNFCESCRGKTNKASKRLHAQKRRNSK